MFCSRKPGRKIKYKFVGKIITRRSIFVYGLHLGYFFTGVTSEEMREKHDSTVIPACTVSISSTSENIGTHCFNRFNIVLYMYRRYRYALLNQSNSTIKIYRKHRYAMLKSI